MERINPIEDTQIILNEHFHRYKWARGFSYGHLCDIACGMGYGSQLLLEKPSITSYIGIDIDSEAVNFAVENYSNDKVQFKKGICENIPVVTSTIDTIISLETLEHLDEPKLAIEEFSRILKSDGLLIGSVPSKQFEEECTVVYGPNFYHKQKFTVDNLEKLLKEKFGHVRFYFSSLNIASMVVPLNDDGTTIINGVEKHQLGSIMFLATNEVSRLNEQFTNSIDVQLISPIIEYDKTYLVSRNETIRDQAKLIDAKDELVSKLEKMIDERDKTITDQTKLVDEKDILIDKIEKMIDERDKTISDQTKLVDEKDILIKKLESIIDERDLAIKNLEFKLKGKK